MIEPEVMSCVPQAKRLQVFLCDCAASTGADQAERLREAAHLLGMQSELRPLVEAMIACHAYESAALLVIGDRPFLLSRGASGACLASAVVAEGRDELTAEAVTPALALLAVHVGTILAELALPTPPQAMAPIDTMRLH